MSRIDNFISRYMAKYMSSKVVFLMDLFCSLLSSACVFFAVSYLTDNAWHGSLLWIWMVASLAGTLAAMFATGSYKEIIRHLNVHSLLVFIMDALIKAAVMLAAVWALRGFGRGYVLAILADMIFTFVLLVAVRVVMIVVYDYMRLKIKDMRVRQRVLVYGTSDKSVAAISRFQNSSHYRVVGFLSGNPDEKNLKLAELPVYTYENEQDFKRLIENLSLGAVLFARDLDVRLEAQGLVKYCAGNNLKTLIIPTVDEVVGGKVMKNGIRQVRIEDLLGRDEIKISMDRIKANFKDKVVMVTGAAGSIGSELCRQLAGFGVKQLVLFDNAETPMHNLRLELEERFPELDFLPVIGSVRHKDRLDYAFRSWKPQVVFHAAAYKHVPLMEENPCEAVFANVYGSRMMADKCVEYGVEMMVMISTDKAVNPTNIMGCSKRLAEIYVQSLGIALAKGEVKGKTKFVTTRFGNVLGSNGSVIPRFCEQIEKGGPVTVTHPDITRFFMTIPEACRLVMEAATMSDGNQIFVFDMGRSVKIADLAKKMIELAGLRVGEDIQIEYTGLRPGEKLYEDVLANDENTQPTSHDRIRIAKVREYSYAEACKAVDDLAVFSRAVQIEDMVKLMKSIVPEFKSKNSRFDIYDK